MAGLVCDIVTREAKLYTGEANMVVVPGVQGSMGFLQGHEPLVSPLADGVVRAVQENGDELAYVCQGGYVQVTGEKVIVLADRALLVSDIETAAVKERLADLTAQLEALTEEELRKTTLPTDISWYKAQLAAKGEVA